MVVKIQRIYHSIVQTVSLAAHALSDPLLAKHPLVLLVLILPTLIRVENQACSGRDLCKRLVSMVVTMLSTG